jgi:hypothetical protein
MHGMYKYSIGKEVELVIQAIYGINEEVVKQVADY